MVPDIEVLVDKVVGLPVGTSLRFDRGVDFVTAPATFRNGLHRLLRARGWVVVSRVSGGSVFVELVSRVSL